MVGIGTGVGVEVGPGDGVAVGVGVAVGAGVGDGVGVDVGSGCVQAARANRRKTLMNRNLSMLFPSRPNVSVLQAIVKREGNKCK